MTNPSTITPQAAPAYLAVEGPYGGFYVVERGTIDGCAYSVIVSPTYGTLAEAQADAGRRQLEAQA